MPGSKYFRVCLGSDGCLVNSYCFVKRYERVTAASVAVSVSCEAMPSFIYPLDEGCYLSPRSYECYCVRHTIFNPQAIMTSLSQSVHWRHPPALLWCQLKYRSCMERCLVMLRGSVGQFYTRVRTLASHFVFRRILSKYCGARALKQAVTNDLRCLGRG